MTIRGTSNQSILTISKETLSECYEVGSDKPGGGAGFSQAGSNEYREVDNATPGVQFVPSEHHLAWGTPQVQDTV